MGVTGTTAAGAYMMPPRPECRAPAPSTVGAHPAALPRARRPRGAGEQPCRRAAGAAGSWSSGSCPGAVAPVSSYRAPTSVSTALVAGRPEPFDIDRHIPLAQRDRRARRAAALARPDIDVRRTSAAEADMLNAGLAPRGNLKRLLTGFSAVSCVQSADAPPARWRRAEESMSGLGMSGWC